MEAKCLAREQEYKNLLDEHKERVEETVNLKKSLADNQKLTTELKYEVNMKKLEITNVKGEANSLEKRIEDKNAELSKAIAINERIQVLEEANTNLKESLFKLAEEYSRDLPEIYKDFEEMTKEMMNSPKCTVSKLTAKEFNSIDNFIEISQGKLPMIAKNCIKLLSILIKFYNETSQKSKGSRKGLTGYKKKSSIKHRTDAKSPINESKRNIINIESQEKNIKSGKMDTDGKYKDEFQRNIENKGTTQNDESKCNKQYIRKTNNEEDKKNYIKESDIRNGGIINVFYLLERTRNSSAERFGKFDSSSPSNKRNLTPYSRRLTGKLKTIDDLPENCSLVQIFNNITKKKGDYFDPSLQYGGKSMYILIMTI